MTAAATVGGPLIDHTVRFPRFRFGMRTLFVAVVVLAVALAYVANRVAVMRGQRAAISGITRTGGTFHWDYEFADDGSLRSKLFRTDVPPPGPTWLRRFAGDDVFTDIEYVQWLDNATVTDDDLAVLSELPGLRTILIGEAGLTDDALIHLAHVPDLEVFCFRGDGITNRRIQQIASLKKLRQLTLINARIDDDAISEIAGLKKLTHLNIPGTAITDKGLSHLAALPELLWLDLADTQITDEATSELAKLRTLKYLNVAATSISDAGIAKLSSLPELDLLNIAGTKVTDDSVAYLVRFRKLMLLKTKDILLGRGIAGVRDKSLASHLTTNISAEGLERLRLKRPDVRIGR